MTLKQNKLDYYSTLGVMEYIYIYLSLNWFACNVVSSAESYLKYKSERTGGTRSRKSSTNKHWEFMFQGVGEISLVVRRFFPEDGFAKSDHSEIARQALKIMRLLQIIKLDFFYLPPMLSERNLFGGLNLSFIAMRASNVLFWNKAEAELVFKQWSWGLEKAPSSYCSTFGKLPGTVSPVVSLLYRMLGTTLSILSWSGSQINGLPQPEKNPSGFMAMQIW